MASAERLSAIPSATGGIARLACARVAEAGKDPAALLAKAGLTPNDFRDSTVRLEVPTQIRLLELAAQELEDNILGFRLARGFDLREIGLVYYVMASSEHVADALRNAERYTRIMNDGVHLRFAIEGHAATIELDYVGVDRKADRHQIEFWMVTLVRICRKVTDGRLVPSQLKMRHLRTRTPPEFRTFFGRDVEFGADADAVSFPAPVSLLPLVGRDGYLHELLRRYADEALARQAPKRATLRSRVEETLTELLPHGRAVATEVARRIGLSTRTLSRKLGEEKTSFPEILDQLRGALAKRYLEDEMLPVSEVAWLLGYRELSSLTHAFKRWTGMTPRQFRAERAQSS
jgi:AraC-like DNA-binding protein